MTAWQTTEILVFYPQIVFWAQVDYERKQALKVMTPEQLVIDKAADVISKAVAKAAAGVKSGRKETAVKCYGISVRLLAQGG